MGGRRRGCQGGQGGGSGSRCRSCGHASDAGDAFSATRHATRLDAVAVVFGGADARQGWRGAQHDGDEHNG